MKSDVGLADFLKYPKLLKAQIKAYQKHLDNHTNTGYWKMIDGSAYNGFYYRLFCRSNDDYMAAITGGLFPENAINPKKVLEDYFGIDLNL